MFHEFSPVPRFSGFEVTEENRETARHGEREMRALKGRLGPGVCPLVWLRGQPHFLLHLIVLWSLMLCGPFASVPRREPKAGRSLVDPCWERLGMWHSARCPLLENLQQCRPTYPFQRSWVLKRPLHKSSFIYIFSIYISS